MNIKDFSKWRLLLLQEGLDIDKLEKAIGNSETFNVREIVEWIVKEANEYFKEHFEIPLPVELKFIHVLKLLAILKKAKWNLEQIISYSEYSKILKEAAGYLGILAFFSQYKNLQNALTPHAKRVLDDYLKIKDLTDLFTWVNRIWGSSDDDRHEEEFLTVVFDKIQGDIPINPIYEEGDVKIYELDSYVHSRKIGGDTEWCVSSSNRAAYDGYIRRGKRLFAFVKNKQKFLLALNKDLFQYREIYGKVKTFNLYNLNLDRVIENVRSSLLVNLRSFAKEIFKEIPNIEKFVPYVGPFFFYKYDSYSLFSFEDFYFSFGLYERDLERFARSLQFTINDDTLKENDIQWIFEHVVSKQILFTYKELKEYIFDNYQITRTPLFSKIMNVSSYHDIILEVLNKFVIKEIYKIQDQSYMYTFSDITDAKTFELKDVYDEEVNIEYFMTKLKPYYERALPEYKYYWKALDITYNTEEKLRKLQIEVETKGAPFSKLMPIVRELESLGLLQPIYEYYDSIRKNKFLKEYYKLNNLLQSYGKIELSEFRNLYLFNRINEDKTARTEFKKKMIRFMKNLGLERFKEARALISSEAKAGNFLMKIVLEILEENAI